MLPPPPLSAWETLKPREDPWPKCFNPLPSQEMGQDFSVLCERGNHSTVKQQGVRHNGRSRDPQPRLRHLLCSFFSPEARCSARQHGNRAPGGDPPALALSSRKALQVGKALCSHSPSAVQRTRGSRQTGETPVAFTSPSPHGDVQPPDAVGWVRSHETSGAHSNNKHLLE